MLEEEHSGAGLLDDEYLLRDYLAERLHLLEEGLTPLRREYELPSARGAGGRVDILARDALDHVVVIEIKRSDKSARETLHELSKYIALLIERDRVAREMIRCFVVSTDWHEVHVPLSYFAATAGVDVRAIEVENETGELTFRPHQLDDISLLPQFSPEISLYQYESEADRAAHLDHIRRRSAEAPFLRVALVVLDHMQPADDGDSPFRTIACIWRIREEHYSRLEEVMGETIGFLEPYGYPGWEAECDAQYWLMDQKAPGYLRTFAEAMRGTPEKISSLLNRYTVVRVERIGDWPRTEVVNSDEQILSQLRANTNLKSTERNNRHLFDVTVDPRIRPSWEKGVAGFLAFIEFEPRWHEAARRYLVTLNEPGATVQLRAYDKSNLFYAIHQARVHPETALSFFEIAVWRKGAIIDGLHGYWAWDGRTCPESAEAAVTAIFGAPEVMWLTLFSAVDTRRYERSYRLHGFSPAVDRLVPRPDGSVRRTRIVRALGKNGTIQDFVALNAGYAAAIAEVFAGIGNVPTSPPGDPAARPAKS